MNKKSTIVGIGVIIVAVLFLLVETSTLHVVTIPKPAALTQTSPLLGSLNKYWVIGDIFLFIVGIALLISGLSE